MHQAFLDYFRCPTASADFRVEGVAGESEGFFRFGPDAICYGRLHVGSTQELISRQLSDAIPHVRIDAKACYLPFDADEVIGNLRRERYQTAAYMQSQRSLLRALVHKTYYAVRPLLPVRVRKHLQRAALYGWDRAVFPGWSVDHTVDRLFEKMMRLAIFANSGEPIPFIWFWPDGFSGCAIMTHDVETAAGRDFCESLMDLNESFGIKSSFQLVPEGRYSVSPELLHMIRSRGFEVNVHDLNHDGRLFSDREEFLRRVERINSYGKQFGAQGYRSGGLYRNLDWYRFLDFSYDMSVPNVGHLDPQPGGCCTTKPFFIGNILEIPVTATQDYSLFHILKQHSMELWNKQIQLILKQNGLLSFIVHPDYVIETNARRTYSHLLARLAHLRKTSNLWICLPGELNKWWRERSQMTLVNHDGVWKIEGVGKQRARICYATLEDDRLVYSADPKPKLARPLASLEKVQNVSAACNL